MLPRWVDPATFSWIPFDCRITPMSQAAECVKEAGVGRIIVAGDSHTRLLFHELLAASQLSGGSVPASKKRGKGGVYQEGPSPPTVKFRVDYADDPLGLEKFSDPFWDEDGAGVTVLLANFGQHPSDGKHGWTLETYVERVLEWQKAAVNWKSASNRREVIWLPSPFTPLRKDAWVRSYKDKRTLQRISMFNIAAIQNMASAQIHVLDNVGVTVAFLTLSDDEAHFTGPPRQFQSVIVLSEICVLLRRESKGTKCRVPPFNNKYKHPKLAVQLGVSFICAPASVARQQRSTSHDERL